MSLKEFLIKRLQAHNCEADLEVLSDYILALLDNGTSPGDLPCQLQDFLHDETEIFICELNEFLEGKEAETENENENEEVEVDYEDDGDDEIITTSVTGTAADTLPQRALREYSPERRNHPNSNTVASKAVRPACTNFIKRGNCRFGDNCRYAHIQRACPSQSRIKLSNLPVNLLNPADLTRIMSKYGDVTGATVYPEKAEASIQFSRGEEAQKAYNEFEYDEQEGIIIELEKEQRKEREHKSSLSPVTVTNVKLQSLLDLQKKQQSILESNLAVQQSLLSTLQNPSLSEAERLESLSTLKSIQEGVMGVQEMLKKTTEMIIEAANTPAYQNKPVYQTMYQNMPKNKPMNPGHNKYNVQKPIRPQKQHQQQQYSQVNYNTKYTASSTSNSHSLDLRPTTLKLSPLPATNLTDIHALQRHFAPYGLIQSLIITEQGQSAVIKYQKHGDAVKALENAGKSFDKEKVEFSFIK